MYRFERLREHTSFVGFVRAHETSWQLLRVFQKFPCDIRDTMRR